jgi:hypothetical protein
MHLLLVHSAAAAAACCCYHWLQHRHSLCVRNHAVCLLIKSVLVSTAGMHLSNGRQLATDWRWTLNPK